MGIGLSSQSVRPKSEAVIPAECGSSLRTEEADDGASTRVSEKAQLRDRSSPGTDCIIKTRELHPQRLSRGVSPAKNPGKLPGGHSSSIGLRAYDHARGVRLSSPPPLREWKGKLTVFLLRSQASTKFRSTTRKGKVLPLNED